MHTVTLRAEKWHDTVPGIVATETLMLPPTGRHGKSAKYAGLGRCEAGQSVMCVGTPKEASLKPSGGFT